MQPSRRTLLGGVAGAALLAATGCTGAGSAGGAPAAGATEDATVAALQRVLDAENVAVYGYGVVGAHLAGAARRAAHDALDAHRVRRDDVAALVAARGARPEAAAAAYALPFPVTDEASAVRLALRLEGGVGKAARALGAAADPRLRALSRQLLADVAAHQQTWRTVSR